MHGLHSLAHQRADDRTEREDICSAELIDALVVTLWLDGCVEIPSIRHIHHERAAPRDIDPDARSRQIRRHVTNCSACNLGPASRVVDPDHPRRYLGTDSAPSPAAT